MRAETGRLNVAGHMLDHGWARAASLAAAVALMLLVTLMPRVLTSTDGHPLDHGTLSLVMLGLCAGFVHGVGFVPRQPVLRVLFGPLVAWPIMSWTLAFYASRFIQ